MKKNILLLYADQFRYDAIGKIDPKIVTPNLDKLTEEGVLFKNAFVQCPLCVPSRVSLMTGRYPQNHKVFKNSQKLPPYEKTMGDILKENGYETVSIGRSHNVNNGFNCVPVPLKDSFKRIEYLKVHEVPWGKDGFIEKADVEIDDFYETRVARTAADFLEDMSRVQPFAMYVGFIFPHPPYIIPEPFFSMYRPEDMALSAYDEKMLQNLPDQLREKHENKSSRQWISEQKEKEMKAAYYGMVSLVDYCIGIIIEKLKSLGLYDNTIIIFNSDHGEMLGEHGLWDKNAGYEASIRVPLIVKEPGSSKKGVTSNALIECIDILPMLLESNGIEVPERIDGRSFYSILSDEEKDDHKGKIFSIVNSSRGIAVRTKEWKYIYSVDEGGVRKELYNLMEDSKEENNLVLEDGYTEVISEMERASLEFFLKNMESMDRIIEGDAFKQYPVFNAQFVRENNK